jgi:hypothetical protein
MCGYPVTSSGPGSPPGSATDSVLDSVLGAAPNEVLG